MKKEITTFDELIEDIESIKADLDWARDNKKQDLISYFEKCLEQKRDMLKEF